MNVGRKLSKQYGIFIWALMLEFYWFTWTKKLNQRNMRVADEMTKFTYD